MLKKLAFGLCTFLAFAPANAARTVVLYPNNQFSQIRFTIAGGFYNGKNLDSCLCGNPVRLLSFDVISSRTGNTLLRGGPSLGFVEAGKSYHFEPNALVPSWKFGGYFFNSLQVTIGNEAYVPAVFSNVTLELGDNIDPIPEPATWATIIGGFGLLGAAARRRTRSSVTYA
jgi:hypothetical protein